MEFGLCKALLRVWQCTCRPSEIHTRLILTHVNAAVAGGDGDDDSNGIMTDATVTPCLASLHIIHITAAGQTSIQQVHSYDVITTNRRFALLQGL